LVTRVTEVNSRLKTSMHRSNAQTRYFSSHK
jgi:hypothetical protein